MNNGPGASLSAGVARVKACIGPLDDAQQEVGQLDNLGRLDRVVELDRPVARGAFVGPDGPANRSAVACCSPPSAPGSRSAPSFGLNAFRISATPSSSFGRPATRRTATSTAFIEANYAVS